MEVIHAEPLLSSLIPLSEHQSQTPQSFYSGPPVLYNHSPDARLLISESDARSSLAFQRLLELSASNGAAAVGRGQSGEEREIVTESVDVWVASDKFILYRRSISVGLAIPYPSISLHAIQPLATDQDARGVFLQLEISAPHDEPDAEGASISLTLVPLPSSSHTTESNAAFASSTVVEGSKTPASALFEALSACANLHPDPVSQPSSDDDDTGEGNHDGAWVNRSDDAVSDHQAVDPPALPPPMPGSSGWITADNVQEFFDSEGNWRGQGLGPGAGNIRVREAEDTGDTLEDRDGDDSKWQRTA